jgi:putative hydrolase of the HAD superfamily
VFDLDDTLYLEREYVCSGFEAVGHWAKTHLNCPDFCECAWKLFLAGRRGDIFDEVLRQMGIAPSPDMIAGMIRVYRTHDPCIRLLPDAQACLQSLRGKVWLALITDGAVESQQKKVHALGLAPFLNRMILTGEWAPEFAKPHPRAYETIAGEFASNGGGTTVYVGDNPAKDFLAPRQLGWQTIRVRREEGLHYAKDAEANCSADVEVKDLWHILELVQFD